MDDEPDAGAERSPGGALDGPSLDARDHEPPVVAWAEPPLAVTVGVVACVLEVVGEAAVAVASSVVVEVSSSEAVDEPVSDPETASSPVVGMTCRGRHGRLGAVPRRGGEPAEAADGDDPRDGRADGQPPDAVDRPVSIGRAAGRRGVHTGHLPDRFFRTMTARTVARFGVRRGSPDDRQPGARAQAVTATFDSLILPARARSLRIWPAASLPGAPITQPPGCVPEPHW